MINLLRRHPLQNLSRFIEALQAQGEDARFS